MLFGVDGKLTDRKNIQNKEIMSTWQSMDTAPKDGTVIEIGYGECNPDEVCEAVWSERPVCMLGNRNGGCKPGWATPYGGDTDSNLPLDPPNFWRHIN